MISPCYFDRNRPFPDLFCLYQVRGIHVFSQPLAVSSYCYTLVYQNSWQEKGTLDEVFLFLKLNSGDSPAIHVI